MPSQSQTIYLYRNGDMSDNGFPLSFSHRRFGSINEFVDYINDELQIAKKKHGYRYIFTTSGDEVTTMHDIEYGKSYVLALNRSFIKLNYTDDSNRQNSDLDDRYSSTRSTSRGASRDRYRRSDRGSRGGSRGSDRRESEVREDEKELAETYNKRREKTRQRNMDRYPSRLKQRSKSDERKKRGDAERSEDDGEDEIEITVYRNGNYTDPGSYIEVKKSDYRSSRFSQFITYINEQMHLLGLSAGIRHVYTLDGKEIRKIDKIKNRGKYVIAAGRFMKLNYGENALYLKGRRRAVRATKPKKSRRRNKRESGDEKSGTEHDRDIEVRVFENGNNTDPGQQIQVPVGKLEEFDDFFDHLKSNMKQKRGYRNLYSEDGKTIRATRQVTDGDQLVIGTGRFINLRYGEHYRKMKHIREKVNRQRQENRDSGRNKRSYSAGDKPRSRNETRAHSRRDGRDGTESDGSGFSETESSTDPYSDYSDDERGSQNSDSGRSDRSEDRGGSRAKSRNNSAKSRNNSAKSRNNSAKSRGKSEKNREKSGRNRENSSRNRENRGRSRQKDRESPRRLTSRERSSLERKKRKRERRNSY